MLKNALAAALCLALVACGGAESPPVAAPPSGDLWSASTPDPLVEAIPSPTQLAVAFDAAPAAMAGALYAEGSTALDGFDELNGARNPAAGIDQALAVARRLVPPASASVRDEGPGERAFGPALVCVFPPGPSGCPADAQVESELRVLEGAHGDYSWTLRVRPVGVEGGWLNVYFGQVAAGEAPGARLGRFVLSLDVLPQIVSPAPASGRLLGGFVLADGEQAFVYRAEDLAVGEATPVTGRLYAHRANDGALRVRFTAAAIDVLPGPGGAEFVANHVGMTSRGGVAYEIIADVPTAFGIRGDVPFTSWPGEAYLFSRSCFGPGRAAIHRETFTCPVGQPIPECVATAAATPLAGYEGGSWDACSSLAGEGTAGVPESGAAAPWNEDPEPGYLAAPWSPRSPEEFAAELGF
jgi:hypothetical protein